MADSGPHNAMCATAGADTECDCDCAGAQHAVLTTGGVPSASKVTARAKRFARANGNPVVENDGSGGSVQSRERGRRLPPPLMAEIERVRRQLPDSRAEWDAVVPRGESVYDMAVRHRQEDHDRRANAERLAVELDQQADEREAALERIYKGMKYRPEKRRKLIAEDPDITHWRQMAESGRDTVRYIDSRQQSADQAVADADNPRDRLGRPRLPKDPNGVEVPTEEHKRHLESILSVGRSAMDAAESEFARDPEIQAARDRMARQQAISAEWKTGMSKRYNLPSDKRADYIDELNAKSKAARAAAGLPDNYKPADDEKLVTQRESAILHEMIKSARPMGGVEHAFTANAPGTSTQHAGHTDRGARADTEDRLRYAEQYFPDDWLAESSAQPLNITSTDRAYYSSHTKTLAMDAENAKPLTYNGGYRDYVDEVTVHELSHRMEYSVPGLMEMEWTYVRSRTTSASGHVETPQKMEKLTGNPAYMDYEIAYPDDWANAYAGKTYERSHRDGEHPGRNAWELLQVGTQDLFGRSKTKFDKGRGLQEFTLGVLLTMGTRR